MFARVAIVWAALALIAPLAQGHGGAGIDEDPCVRRAGLYLIHFAAYQPQVDPAGEYCDEIPKAENAIFVFDLVDRELRKEPAAIHIERRAAEGASVETLFSIPAQLYPTGVVNTEFRFEGPGEYAAVVTLAEPDRVIRFPLRVEMWSRSWIPLAGLALILGVPLGYFAFTRLRKAAEEGV